MILDLFAGAGGWDLALRALFPKTKIIGIEIDPWANCTRLAAKLETLPVDVRTFPLGELRSWGPIEGLVASPPCQAFSKGGHREGLEDPRGELVHEPMRYARAFLPPWIACEQVPEVLPIWREAAEELRTLGYEADARLLRAEQFGVPQSRTRAFLFASRERRLVIPSPTHATYAPDEARVSLLPAPIGWADALGLDRTLTLRTGMDHRPDGTSQMRDGWAPCPTIGTRSLSQWRMAPAGPVARGRRPHGAHALTAAQLGALQGFPLRHPWEGNAAARARQIGNAIPPPLACAAIVAATRGALRV